MDILNTIFKILNPNFKTFGDKQVEIISKNVIRITSFKHNIEYSASLEAYEDLEESHIPNGKEIIKDRSKIINWVLSK